MNKIEVTVNALLPCPFCGSENIFTEPDEMGSGGQWVAPIHVGCVDCKAEQSGEDSADATTAWNRRAAPVLVMGKPDASQSARYLTIIYNMNDQTVDAKARALLSNVDWVAAGWSHAFQERDDARKAISAAPVSGQDASIGDDDQFKLLLAQYYTSDEDTESMACERKIFSYIDSRPRSEDSRTKVDK